AAAGRALMRVARAARARKPSQSPVADTIWVSQSRKKAVEPNSRTCARESRPATASMARVGTSAWVAGVPTGPSPGRGGVGRASGDSATGQTLENRRARTADVRAKRYSAAFFVAFLTAAFFLAGDAFFAAAFFFVAFLRVPAFFFGGLVSRRICRSSAA